MGGITKPVRMLAAMGAAMALMLVAPPQEAAVAHEPAGIAAWRADSVHGRPLPDPATTSPSQVATFFAGLSPDERAGLVDRHPRVVGNLDGAPLDLRYAANLGVATSAMSVGRQVLAFDPRGDGEVVEVLGDLATARRVAVIVPGVDNTLARFDRGLGGVRDRAPAVQARHLYREMIDGERGSRAGGQPVAVIAWLGYDTPEGFSPSMVRSERALDGANRFVRFMRGIEVVNPEARVTVIGHSYGSVVAGYAASRLPSDVTDIVAIGSPGMGVANRDGLHTSARVWAARADGDWMRWVPGVQVLGVGFGMKPDDPSFGARSFSTVGADGHDRYFAEGTEALRNLARVGLGEPELVSGELV
ncbi:hypothetical protein GCM10012275_31450 [Longimycelium tulufanense]|uniref:DUF1023 domain-containing protein n=1 Tax=Longimycelium tulufanense TaxID=907463 RepID=A0A8J3CFA1_9PSEU|nr:alpha/beta hydrolase [Longimycelium tulufanense]GGM57964.1 hypothetical protein GCM10012275_31450 [Longimycelium tulufanense]